MDPSYIVSNIDDIPTPSLLIYRERVKANISRMLETAGGPDWLRPHVKTHKMASVIKMKMQAGIYKFKCATLQEARMIAEVGGKDVFVAYQMVGPNVQRLISLILEFPETVFRVMADDSDAISSLSAAATSAGVSVDVLIDLDVGQHRTGIAVGPSAVALYKSLNELPGVTPGGIHAYDGHNHQSDLAERRQATDECLDQVRSFQRAVEAEGIPVARRVMGGSISFPCYAEAGDVESSPGTGTLWDWGYQRRFDDLGFEPAALLLSRIISIPTTTRATLDLGYKAIASDPMGERGIVWSPKGVELVFQNEEHWVMETSDTSVLRVGQPAYVFPTHICPTSALHRYVYVIDENGRFSERWEVTARDRE
jgi:D-threonine aldolase